MFDRHIVVCSCENKWLYAWNLMENSEPRIIQWNSKTPVYFPPVIYRISEKFHVYGISSNRTKVNWNVKDGTCTVTPYNHSISSKILWDFVDRYLVSNFHWNFWLWFCSDVVANVNAINKHEVMKNFYTIPRSLETIFPHPRSSVSVEMKGTPSEFHFMVNVPHTKTSFEIDAIDVTMDRISRKLKVFVSWNFLCVTNQHFFQIRQHSLTNGVMLKEPAREYTFKCPMSSPTDFIYPVTTAKQYDVISIRTTNNGRLLIRGQKWKAILAYYELFGVRMKWSTKFVTVEILSVLSENEVVQ